MLYISQEHKGNANRESNVTLKTFMAALGVSKPLLSTPLFLP